MSASQDFLRRIARLAARTLLNLTVTGSEHVPLSGGVLLAMNHIGDADSVLVIGYAPRLVTVIGKAEILEWPVIGALARAYGMLPVKRGEPDRATLQTAINVLRTGQALLIAPEGRESPTAALERAKAGAAFIAQHARVPIVPIAVTGTTWKRILPEWRRLRRPSVTLAFGAPFTLPSEMKRANAADEIMRHIARLLPADYRGVYAHDL